MEFAFVYIEIIFFANVTPNPLVIKQKKNISVNIFIPFQYFKHFYLISSRASGFLCC